LNTLYKFIISALIICLFLSAGLNLFFIKGKGIQIDQSVTNHQEQYQQQWQGQLLINQFMTQGNAVEWKILIVEGKDTRESLDKCKEELDKLHPLSSFFSKISVHGSNTVILYPDIFTKTKEVEIKK